jgi:hypothetical protein
LKPCNRSITVLAAGVIAALWAESAFAQTLPAPEAGVTFTAAPGVALHTGSRRGIGDWQRLCLAPCSLSTAPSAPYALSLDGDTPIPARIQPTMTPPGTRLEGEYRSRSSARHAGWLILGIGIPSALATIGTGIAIATNENTERGQRYGVGVAVAGGVALATSTIIGAIFASRSDEARVYAR